MGERRRIFVGIAVIVLVLTGIVYSYIRDREIPATIKLDIPDKLTTAQTIEVPLTISTRQTMNAAEFYFKFPAELLEVESISKDGSIYQLWITDYPKFDNKTGLISFAGGLPTPGFSGKNGLVATVKFKVKTAGKGLITLDEEKSRVLANDSDGTVIKSVFESIEVAVK